MTADSYDALRRRLSSLTIASLPVALNDAGTWHVEPRDGALGIMFTAGFPAAPLAAEIDALARSAAAAEGIDAELAVDVRVRIRAHAVRTGLKPLAGVSNIVAVASGKGGVGKSTTAVNLALALAAAGARTGVLDADIYGPSQPRMLGLTGQHPESPDGKSLEPLTAHGVQAMSIGFLVDEERPMVWRGPMVTQALNQILLQTRWRDLDYLIVDMPPGTGDIQLTLSQRVPVAGAVIVTTPQDIALSDARKGLEMFRKVGIPVLGIVENMSLHVCSQCGHEEPVFGSGGGERLAGATAVPLLGQLPLELAIREQADGGRPTVVAAPDSAAARHYRDAALAMSAALAGGREEHAHKFPNIVVENS